MLFSSCKSTAGSAIRIGLAIFLSWGATTFAQDAPASAPKRTKHKGPSSNKNPREFTLVGAGDIAGCEDLSGARATAKLIDKIPGTVFAAGDLAYNDGTWEEFQNCYGPTWGRFKERTKPTPGNHEYKSKDSSATGYFRYWGEQAGDPEKGYYSYDLGAWHVVVLNTNCGVKLLGGCGEGSREEVWLKDDLAAHPNACIVAYGHHSLFSSGLLPSHAMHPELRQFWKDLYSAHAELMLAGHEHSYERFAMQNPDGKLDEQDGIRLIVAGTGGKSHTPLPFAQPNSVVRNTDTYGVLKLTLAPGKYKWEFIPEAGKHFRDTGEGTCHNHPPTANSSNADFDSHFNGER